MGEPRACPACLRRAWLLRSLCPYIERVASGAVGSRSQELLRLPDDELAAAVAPKVAAHLLSHTASITERRFGELLAGAECWACCHHDERFPQALRDADDGPSALICRGAPERLGRLRVEGAVTIVGSRRASAYGRGVARELGRELAAAGMVVVSGMAFGIDGCAHRGALDAGETVAVLGCGADIAYPAPHRGLWRRICERGLVVSELPPGATPWRWTFPARNRIMAAAAGMTVVVEAAERSGSLITADIAADLGRDLGAVPGPVTSRVAAGSNALLAGGACVVRDAQDVLDALLGVGVCRVRPVAAELAPGLSRVLGTVERGAAECDAVAVELGLSAAEVASALTQLELLGYLERSLTGSYLRTSRPAPVEEGAASRE